MSLISESIKKHHHSFCSAVVVAAGESSRMGEDKLMMPLGGKPVLAWTLTALNACAAVDEIIVVTRESKLQWVGALKAEYCIGKLRKVVLGGATRTESALAGVSEVSKKAKIICIHDGARPFVTREIIEDAVHQAVLHYAAAPAVPVKDTIKSAVGGFVDQTLDRNTLFAVQTPQAFHADLIKGALTKAVQAQISYTDDCAATEAMGVRTFLSLGSEENLKITTPADLLTAEQILKKWGGRPV